MRWVQNNHQNIDLLSYIYDMIHISLLIRTCVETRDIEDTSTYVNFFTQLVFSSLNDKLVETSQGYRERCPLYQGF